MKPWPKVRLGEAVTPAQRAEAPMSGTTYRQIGVKLWGEGAYEHETMDGSQTKYAQLFRAEAGDIIVNKIWARNGSVAVVPESLAGCFGSGEFPMFAPKLDKLESRWMHWLTKTPGFWAQCDEKSQGTSGKNRIKPELFLNVEIPLPPLAEQRRVVARIEALVAQIHEARTLRHQASEEAEVLVQVRRFRLIEDCPSVNKVRFEDLVTETQLGLDRGTSQQSPEYPTAYLKMNNITTRGTTDIAEVTRVNASEEEIKKFSLRSGDFLFNTRNSFELVGKTAVWENADEPFIFNNNIMRIRFGEQVEPRFMNAAFISPVIANQLLQFKKQTTSVCALYWKNLKEVLIPVPPLAEQRRIVAELDALQAEVDALKRLQAETAAELDALLPALLDRAFKGEL